MEQLRVHVRNLSMLGVDGPTGSKGSVELFERGYGKDAAGIAKEAIAYARDNNFDVVLIDTAGRMQDNEVWLPHSDLSFSSLLILPSSPTAFDACPGQAGGHQLSRQDPVRRGGFGWERGR